MRQSNQSSFPSGQVHWELWFYSLHNFRGHTGQQNSAPKSTRKFQQFFLRGPGGHFRPGERIIGVNTSMSATSADKVTRPVNAAPQPTPLPKPAHFQTQNPPMCDPIVSLIRQPPVTPVNLENLKFYLQGYDESLADFLISGFKYGFGVNFFGEQSSYESFNFKSAYDYPDVVRAKLRKELEAGRISGLFPVPPFPAFRTSPLGVVPKKTPSEYRLIHHLSYPPGRSVDDFIPKELPTVHYATIDDVISIIKKLGPGCYMAITEIQSAFRLTPIHPKDFNLLGMRWEGRYYFDRCLPMGLHNFVQPF